MKPRIRMQIVADAAQAQQGRFHALMIVEGIETGDKRLFVENSLGWRDLPLPCMATDRSDHGAIVDAPTVLIGNFDTIERVGTELHGYGPYLESPDEEAGRLIALVQSGELSGFSADIDDVEYEVLFPTTDANGDPLPDPFMDLFAEPGEDAADSGPPTENIDGVEYEVIAVQEPIMRVTQGRIMGGTVVPFPAFQEAFIEDDSGERAPALAASGAATFASHLVHGAIIEPLLPQISAAVATSGASSDGPREASPARFNFPVIPPREWFEVPETPGPMPLTILDSGQVFGHLAVWGECHVGIAGECVEPPPSQCGYARFHVGEVPLDDGSRVACGRLTFHTGHADRSFGPGPALAHYDNTGSVAADIVAHDGAYGIWVCGAARSTLTHEQVREVLSSPPSGDWRRFGRDLELVGALCVNVPGFNTPRALVRREEGLVASLIVSHPAPRQLLVAGTTLVGGDLAARLRERIAASIGRTHKDRIAALAARVHGGN